MKVQTDGSPAFLSSDQASVFCYQFALMQKAGIGLEESASILLEDAKPGWERPLLERLHASLAEGAPLSQAMEKAGAFPDYLRRMVEIGQASGRLDQVLDALSDYYRREAETQSAIRRAVAYPALMAVLVALIFLVLMARVLPVFRQVFNQLGMSLSPLAEGLLRLGDASQAVAAVLSALLLVFAAGLMLLLHTARGAQLSKRLGRALFGGSASSRSLGRSRFASAMALMLSSGLPLDEAVERTGQLLEGSALEHSVKACQEHMYAGVSFPAAVEQAGILSGLQAGLLAAGFRAGASEQAMEELSRRCQTEADERLGRLLGRFEYGLVLTLCLSVGLVLLSVMLPLLGVMSAIGA
ncbi:putative type II secretion system protein F [bioreactor metagenome]|uniref:Putative type II secretion system protein F n=1 Tax=bioreactor metagenome TaxID=1076179 RepID=A0A644W9H5_9ZZZZ